MAQHIAFVRIRRKRETYEWWQKENPVLLYGEIGIAYDIPDCEGVDRIKIGDGNTPYMDLPWLADYTKISKADIGQPFGPAPLDASGRIPREYFYPRSGMYA